jgi:hypothetical protein
MTAVERRDWEWAVLSEDGIAYVVGTYCDGEYRPGSLRRAIREWWLLRRDEPKARIVRKARSLDRWWLA